MSTALRSALLLSLVGATLALLPSSAEAARRDHLRVDVGAGMGVDYGMAGAMGGVDLRVWRGMGLSANVGVGAGLGGSAYLWSPGRRVRAGVGASAWRSWDTWRPEPCSSCGTPSYTAPGPQGEPGTTIEPTPSGLFAASLQAAVDHDFGAPGGWAMRYGLGLGVVASGGAGAVLPAPSLGLRYAF